MENTKMIGRYAIQKPLSNTSYATIYLALDTVLNRNVRLNVFDPARLRRKSLRVALNNALQQAADLVHPHIAWIWDLGEDDGTFYAAERFVDGETLEKFLQMNQRMTWDQAYPVFRQVAQGLEFAHSHKVLHGDLSPANLILSPGLGAILMNFGLREVFYPNIEITRYSDQSDLGRLLLMMISGRVEIPEEPDMDELWPLSAPRFVADALKRALGLDPKGPFASIEEFATAISECASRPQPPLTPQQIQRLEAEEAHWREMQEKARQAEEEAVRREALDAARKEIDEQLQRAINENTRLEENQSASQEDQSQRNIPGEAVEQEPQTDTQPATGEITESSGQAPLQGDGVLSVEKSQDVSASKKVSGKKRRTVFWVVGIIVLILVLSAIIWGFLNGYWNTIFQL